ncbi:uncharacterized protein LOC129581153 [Paramacrobiotus metropolitanus]|uniref:uncharacterized protein LOC129581153 n=1 Tax=Paramacrobiotus metropolitanus TaxID=2943436 RepID=UPI002445E481|nr:uncharacterized protein LOC129581153 [Paramacrobiotus metropolitanus]XP_055328036.1 uncharacterized protein LOC129581153 [Paramacrobiotus metropolitanus]XP_055328037.1 uncharacterized protein LOC129581153 [Paramacrobiotus metropolitanus]
MAGPPAIGALHREWMDKTKKLHASADEKYDLLNVRDKIIRLVSKSQGSSYDEELDSAPLLKGTCIEMCPEKERYERIKQERVGLFEQEKYMVKDFSRQAADQEMPLPSELRTQEALQTTMNYLLREIIANPMDIPEGSLCAAGWYDFIWRRIRAIRKEITQQRLSGVEIARILEQMCRFHIVSFHMFCEVDRNQFDSKLNLENLNDCLAGLERVYHQMERAGEASPHLAEFRAYEMFLRIWTDRIDLVKITLDAAKFDKSREVVFVKKVISSVNNKSYTDYIALMRQADYCLACLMHLYLPVMQASALRALYRSCGGGRSRDPKSAIGLKKLQLMLGIETDIEMLRFCTHNKLEIDRENGVVSFPTGFHPADPKLYKRTLSRHIHARAPGNMAEAVAKQKLEEIPAPQIVEICSFDDNGLYIGIDPFEVIPGKEEENVKQTPAARSPTTKNHVDFGFDSLSSGAKPLSVSPMRFDVPYAQPSNAFQFSANLLPSSPGIRLPSTSLPTINSSLSGFTRGKRVYSDSDGLDEDVVEIPQSPNAKRVHVNDPVTVTPARRPSLEISRPLQRTPSRKVESPIPLEDAIKKPIEVVELRRYPNPTHPVLLHARSICQAQAAMKNVFVSWIDHIRKIRSPTRHFADLVPTDDQVEFADRLRYHEERQLLWSPFPLRNIFCLPHNSDLVVCTVMIMVVSIDSEHEPMSRWLHVKFGQVTGDNADPVHELTCESEGRSLRLIFMEAIGNSTVENIERYAKELNGVMLFCRSRSDLEYGKERMDELKILRANRPTLPVVVFCCDATVTRSDIADLTTNEDLLLDFFVPQANASLVLACAVWESFLWVIQHRARNPHPVITTLSSVLSEMFGQFVTIYRTVKREIQDDLSLGDTVWIWNRVVEVCLANVELNMSKENCGEPLLQMIDASTVLSFLKLEHESSWTRSPFNSKVVPFAGLFEIENEKERNRDVFAAASEKVAAVMPASTGSDPVILRYSDELPDFELLLLELLEKFEEYAPDTDATEVAFSQENTPDSQHGMSNTGAMNADRRPVLSDNELEAFQQKKLEVSRWLTEVTNLLDNVDIT